MEYDILMKFSYDGEDYIIYTDNTYDKDGNFNLYGASTDSEGRLVDVHDPDMFEVFEAMMRVYKEKVLKGEL